MGISDRDYRKPRQWWEEQARRNTQRDQEARGSSREPFDEEKPPPPITVDDSQRFDVMSVSMEGYKVTTNGEQVVARKGPFIMDVKATGGVCRVYRDEGKPRLVYTGKDVDDAMEWIEYNLTINDINIWKAK